MNLMREPFTQISTLPAGVRPSANWFDESGGPNAQTMRQLHNVEQADVSLAAFHSSHVISV